MSAIDIQRDQHDAMPQENLSAYAGQWVALRAGHVVAADLDALALRANPDLENTDEFVLVPRDDTSLLIL